MRKSSKFTSGCATATLLALSAGAQAEGPRREPAASAAKVAPFPAAAPGRQDLTQCGLNADATACSRPPALCRGCALLRRLQDGSDELDDPQPAVVMPASPDTN